MSNKTQIAVSLLAGAGLILPVYLLAMYPVDKELINAAWSGWHGGWLFLLCVWFFVLGLAGGALLRS